MPFISKCNIAPSDGRFKDLMTSSNIWEILKNLIDGELERKLRSGITALNEVCKEKYKLVILTSSKLYQYGKIKPICQTFYILVLGYEFPLHRPPHNLEFEEVLTYMTKNQDRGITCTSPSSSQRCLSTFLYSDSSPFFTSLPGYIFITFLSSCLLYANW